MMIQLNMWVVKLDKNPNVVLPPAVILCMNGMCLWFQDPVLNISLNIYFKNLIWNLWLTFCLEFELNVTD